tara:strand:- start:268 stop:609 length:342 start_codon:yes stop_codon:yes gene_type:complete
MKEISNELKKRTIAIDFDGVIHRYSEGWKGMDNAYDPPSEGTSRAIRRLYNQGYRLVIFTSRSVDVVRPWLLKYGLLKYFDDITNTKIPAKVYIDDRGYKFENWEKTIEDLFE